jgi:hypothetical protein
VAQLLKARRQGHPHRHLHETYLVRAGEYEAAYGNMPPYGLGEVSKLVTVAEGSTARGRLKRRIAS